MTLHPDHDQHLEDVLDLAAQGFDPAPDLRERVDRRLRQQRRATRLGLVAGLLVLVVLAASVTAFSRRNGDLAVDSGDPVASQPVASDPAVDGAAAPALDWSTPQVRFLAREVRIEVAGATFTGTGDGELHSDPGTPDRYQTLERIWTENGVEMRMNIYFASDGVDWWSNEIRTYNGEGRPAATWITYTGDFFRRPLGEAFTGDLTLPEQAADVDGEGVLVIRGLELQPFLPPDDCVATGGFTLEVPVPAVVLAGAGSLSGYSSNVRLRDDTCAIVTDLAPYTFVVTVDDPTVVTAIGGCIPDTPYPGCEGRVSLSALVGVGETDVRVSVQRTADGTVVATGSQHVVVQEDPAKWPTDGSAVIPPTVNPGTVPPSTTVAG